MKCGTREAIRVIVEFPMAFSVDHDEVLLDTKFYLGRPLGGGRPVPPSRSERRKPTLSTLLGIENFPGESKCGAGVEVQLRARHSYASFFKAWYVAEHAHWVALLWWLLCLKP